MYVCEVEQASQRLSVAGDLPLCHACVYRTLYTERVADGLGEVARGEVGAPGTGPRRSCYSDTGMLAMPLSKVAKSRENCDLI